jgi:hypothetical protein
MSPLKLARDAASGAGRGIREWFFGPADPRAYAALRIGYAVSALAVLIDLFPFRHTLFAETGMFGGSFGGGLPILDVFTYARSELAVTSVFIVAALAAVALALGVWQRASAFVLYSFAASYTAAAPMAQSGFDTILRVVGFVMVLCPTVSTWSIRPRRAASAPPAYALRLVQWQVMLIYVCTAWLKAPDQFWRNGEAIPYFWMSMFARHPTPLASHHPVIGAMFTYGTLLIECSLPFLLWSRKWRFAGIFLGLSLHIGIALTSRLALFTITVTSLYTAFLETEDFERVLGWFSSEPAAAEDAAASLESDGTTQSRPVRTTQ